MLAMMGPGYSFFMSIMLAKKFRERLHWFDMRAENLESSQDRNG
jgi:hypothetical protein